MPFFFLKRNLLIFTLRKPNTDLFVRASVYCCRLYLHVFSCVWQLTVEDAEQSFKRSIKCCGFVSIVVFKGMMFHSQVQ